MRSASSISDRYALYCGAATYAEAIGLGMKSGIKTGDAYYDLDHGYLHIFPDSLRAETLVEEDGEVEGGADPGEGPVTALLKEFASMRLKMLPMKHNERARVAPLYLTFTHPLSYTENT
jgi:hypothetical protein